MNCFDTLEREVRKLREESEKSRQDYMELAQKETQYTQSLAHYMHMAWIHETFIRKLDALLAKVAVESETR